ncbi:MAG: hypothetical protein ACLTZB_08720 [Streptococcus salivarius]
MAQPVASTTQPTATTITRISAYSHQPVASTQPTSASVATCNDNLTTSTPSPTSAANTLTTMLTANLMSAAELHQKYVVVAVVDVDAANR